MRFTSAVDGNHYRKFVRSFDLALKRVEITDQHLLMAKLFKLENDFKQILLETEKGRGMYDKFIIHILEEKQNLLDSRLYFRERQHMFADKIYPAIRVRSASKLHAFRINIYFINWVLENYPHKGRKDLYSIADVVNKIRQQMLEENLPSVVHSVRVFCNKCHYSHLDYMDFIQNASIGFLSAVDQYEPPYKKNFGSVVTSRMKESMMEDHNSTLLHVEQQNRRILYRIRKAQQKLGLVEEELVSEFGRVRKYVHESFEKKTDTEIKNVMSVMNMTNFHDVHSKDESVEGIMLGENNPEQLMIQTNTSNALIHSVEGLTLFEKKLLLLKFGNLDFLT
jgi:RNA polymerase sigma factor (sigma-70 family)